jgi:hypothetical protein
MFNIALIGPGQLPIPAKGWGWYRGISLDPHQRTSFQRNSC